MSFLGRQGTQSCSMTGTPGAQSRAGASFCPSGVILVIRLEC
jgi:hypothetical protein